MHVPRRNVVSEIGECRRFRRKAFSAGWRGGDRRKESSQSVEAIVLVSTSRLARNAAIFDLVEQRLVAHAELFRSAPPIPLDLIHRVLDDRALGFGYCA